MPDAPPHAAYPDPHAVMPVGEALRRERLRYGQSLADVAAALKIQERQLDALERGDLAALPGPAYALGFVRAYAGYLRLNVGEVVALFKAQSQGAAEPKPDLNFPVPAGDSAAVPWWAIGGGLAAAAALVVGWALWAGGPDASDPAVVPSPPAVVAAPIAEPEEPVEAAVAVPVAEPEPEPAPEPEPELAPAPAEVVLTLTADSWVEVRGPDGAQLVARVLKAGERYRVPADAGLTMTVGNAGGVALSVGGRALAPLGPAGQAVRGIPLEAGALTERYGQ
jgi:cytoskeleton protein RodZ